MAKQTKFYFELPQVIPRKECDWCKGRGRYMVNSMSYHGSDEMSDCSWCKGKGYIEEHTKKTKVYLMEEE